MYKTQPSEVRKRVCPNCRGSGKVFKNDVWNWGWKPCPPCKGTGSIEYSGPIHLPPVQRDPLKFRRP